MIRVPAPQQQIDFSFAFEQARTLFLQEALGTTVASADLSKIDGELQEFAPSDGLAALAARGLRGELLFCVPYLLNANPRLLAYYRLMLGYSQKVFYTQATGLAGLKKMEEKGQIPDSSRRRLPNLCRALNQSAALLLDGVGRDRVSRALLDDLSLLTLGPQLRGGANVRKGDQAIDEVFHLIGGLVGRGASSSTRTRIVVTNAAGRKVLIEFAADPDIVVREEMSGGEIRKILAIEIKGGEDFSNIHNRIGEAEKSHQKARKSGYQECWTVVNVSRLDEPLARRESPTTDRFYLLSDLRSKTPPAWTDFSDRMMSLTGLPHRSKRKLNKAATKS